MSAYQAGRAAGHLLLTPSLNPFADGSPDHLEWDRGWRITSAEEIASKDAQRRVTHGVIAAEACSGIDERNYS